MADFDKQYYVGVSALGRIIARKKEVKKRLRQEKEIFCIVGLGLLASFWSK